jgi:hypothetical protein
MQAEMRTKIRQAVRPFAIVDRTVWTVIAVIIIDSAGIIKGMAAGGAGRFQAGKTVADGTDVAHGRTSCTYFAPPDAPLYNINPPAGGGGNPSVI